MFVILFVMSWLYLIKSLWANDKAAVAAGYFFSFSFAAVLVAGITLEVRLITGMKCLEFTGVPYCKV